MKIQLKKQSPFEEKTQTLVLFLSQNPKGKVQFPKGLPKSVQELLGSAVEEKALTAELGEARLFRNAQAGASTHLLSVGLGAEEKISTESLRRAASFAFKKLKESKMSNAAFDLLSLLKVKDTNAGVRAAVEGVLLTNYDFDDYKTKPKEAPVSLKTLTLLASGKLNPASLKKALEEAEITSEAVNFAKWLGDHPGNLMTPTILAQETQKKSKGTGLKVTVWDKARIKKEKMGGLLGVSLGSSEEPRFIIMEYKGAGVSKKPIALVGKGLTFDSGGISIKPSQSMDEMKYDMCGGAAVIAAMTAIAKLKLKVNVIGLVASTENMPGPAANKPGDILYARNGKSVEVLNTDAEGRLILMDALSYACEQKPQVILDTATLTGAVVIALGNSYSGVFTRDEKLWGKIKAAADLAGDPVWQMPLNDDHVADMKGIHADLSNISSFKGAGSSTAAAFLEQFVEKDIPWAHIDIAGTAWNVANRVPYAPKKGASGSIVRTFVEFAKAAK